MRYLKERILFLQNMLTTLEISFVTKLRSKDRRNVFNSVNNYRKLKRISSSEVYPCNGLTDECI